jgi:hypothetical protein
MVNEDILTSLRNAVDHGESLENAIRLALNSGYNQRDVQEAAQFVSGGTITNFQTQPSERLAMPSQKKPFSQNPVLLKNPPSQAQPQIQPKFENPLPQIQSQPKIENSLSQIRTQPQPITNPPLQFQPIQQQTPDQNSLMQDLSDIKQNISTGYTTSDSGYVSSSSSSSSLSQEIDKMKPHENYIKEIILLVVLLVLVGVLISTFIFKDQLLGLFTGL